MPVAQPARTTMFPPTETALGLSGGGLSAVTIAAWAVAWRARSSRVGRLELRPASSSAAW